MATTPTYINQRINNLQAQINSIISGGGGGVPTSSNLADVLDNGNSAGAFDVNMNSQDILAVDNINTVTINSSLGALTLPSPVAFTNAIAPTCNANPQNPLELCNKQYVDSQSVLTAYQLYFNYSVPYTVPSGSTYSELSQVQVVNPQTIAWSTSSTSPVFLAGFFNLLTNLNITSIPAGVWTLLAFANLTSVAGQGREAFFYTIIGTASTGAETILYTSPASLLLNTVTPLIGSVSIQGTIPLISLVGYTGLGIKLYIQANTATLTTGSIFYQTLNSYSSILTSVLPISSISTLDQVLIAGNSAGTTDVDMNSNDILSVNNLTVASPYNFSVVSIFVDATARDTAIPSPYTGQMCFLSGSNKVQYWNVNWYNVNVQPNSPIVTGFTIATQYEIIYLNASNTVITAPTLDGFTVVRFFPTTTTSGTITIPNTASTDYLVVGGGGGGGGAAFVTFNGGGGGAGGLLTATDLMVASTSYSVSVGQGGTAGAIAGSGGSGANSSLFVDSGLKTSTGGGGGGGGVAGVSGGSGGGGGWNTVVKAGGAGTVGQGNNGGSSTISPAYPYSGGGGGGSAVGSSANGQGGVGTSSSITGSAIFYSGGGGGGASTGVDIGANPLPTGGNGGGGNGGYKSGPAVAPVAGTNGRGGGGGGRGNWTSLAGAAGGSGVVIVRFASYS